MSFGGMNMRYEHLNEEELRIIAKQRIKLKQGMKTHVLVFLLVNLFLTILYFVATPGGYPWVFWVYLGWGIGMVIHFTYAIYMLNHDGESDVDKEIRKMIKE